MKTSLLRTLIFAFIAGTLLFSCAPKQSSESKTSNTVPAGSIDRTVLPVKAPPRQTSSEMDIRNASLPERFEVKAPEGAPNVILVLLDDLGFAGTSAFGGPVSTPSFDRIAKEGI